MQNYANIIKSYASILKIFTKKITYKFFDLFEILSTPKLPQYVPLSYST